MNKKITVVLGSLALMLIAGVAMALDTGGRPWTTLVYDEHDYTLNKVCDEGRAVYIAFSHGHLYNRGVNSMVIVENARECQF